jgi:hypothetical protein
VLFPNGDQRNTQELFSKAKRKVLLLQKGAATDHSLIGRTHLGGKSTEVIFLIEFHAPMRTGPAWAPNTPWLASIWHKGKVFPCSDILQFNETVIAHGLQLSEE